MHVTRLLWIAAVLASTGVYACLGRRASVEARMPERELVRMDSVARAFMDAVRRGDTLRIMELTSGNRPLEWTKRSPQVAARFASASEAGFSRADSLVPRPDRDTLAIEYQVPSRRGVEHCYRIGENDRLSLVFVRTLRGWKINDLYTRIC